MEIMNNPNVEIVELNKNKNDNEIRFDLNTLSDCNFKKMIGYIDSVSMYLIEYTVTASLVALSAAVGKHVYWQFTKNRLLFLNIWGVIIGPSTILKKSSAIRMAVHDLERIDLQKRNDYKRKKEIYDKQIGGKNSKELADIPKPKREYLIFPSDVTIESLSNILAQSSKGAMFHSEFGTFLAQLGRSYSQDAKPVLTDLYDVPAFKEIARATKDNIFMERPFLSILGASQIDWIKENSSKDDLRTGFFARMLFSIRNKNDKDFIPSFDMDKLSYSSPQYFDTRKVYDYLTNITEEKVLSATEAAKEINRKYEKEVYRELTDLAQSTDRASEIPFLGRLMDYTLKIAGVIALCDERFEVTEADMKNAISLTNYYKRNIEKLIHDELVTKSDFAQKEERILSEIKKAGTIARTPLQQKNIVTDVREFNRIIENLLEKDQIEAFKEQKTKGKWAQCYRFKTA